MNRSDIIRLTEEIGFLPEQKFGQNFLCNEKISGSIVDLCGISPSDKVLEIGPGLGSLTSILTTKTSDLTCIEIDKRLAEYISEAFGCNVISQDYLKVPAEQYNASEIDVAVSNIPYYVMTPIIKKLLTDLKNVRILTLMVEKEALDRLLAAPGTKQYGPLSIICCLFGGINVEFDLGGDNYYPAPRTVSTVFTMKRGDNAGIIDQDFLSFLEKAFMNRRKKITNNLDLDKDRVTACLISMGYNANTRAEEISAIDYIKLYNETR